MDDSLQEFEAELKSLKPRRASDCWLRQINRELAAELPPASRPSYVTATNLDSWQWWGWRTAGVAAAVTMLLALGLFNFRRPASTPPAGVIAAAGRVDEFPGVPTYQPVAAANVLYDLKDEGAVGGDVASRRVRARYVDTYTWKNPHTNASIKWTVPREEVRVMPASFTLN